MKLTKRQLKDSTIRSKLPKLTNCPFCYAYTAMGGDKLYRCSQLGEVTDYLGLKTYVKYPLTSFVKCTYSDMTKCALLGNCKEEQEATQ